MMGFDTVRFLAGLFGVDSAPVAAMAESAADDHLAGTPFAGWVRRPDCHGRMGWEAPGLAEADRWWARCTFDDLPELPADRGQAGSEQPTPQDARGCVSRGSDDTKYLPGLNPMRGEYGGLTGCEDR